MAGFYAHARMRAPLPYTPAEHSAKCVALGSASLGRGMASLAPPIAAAAHLQMHHIQGIEHRAAPKDAKCAAALVSRAAVAGQLLRQQLR